MAFWLAALSPFLLFPSHLQLASQIAITALFALSLDLLLGYAGIVSLGHAAFFGLGAYAAGLLAKGGWGEPLSGLAAAAAAAGLAGYAASFIVARVRHLALIMVTLGLGLLVHEVANKAHWLTGGADGLQGVRMWPLLGRFRFDLYGYTAYGYSLAVLALAFLVVRRLVHSPFGLSLRGIRENPVRMPALGAPSRSHVRTAYAIAAALAGLAGALLAQTTETVSLATLDFQRSAEVLVILILGGAGRLYGSLVGAVIFLVARDQFSGLNPQYWYFWIGRAPGPGRHGAAQWRARWARPACGSRAERRRTVRAEAARPRYRRTPRAARPVAAGRGLVSAPALSTRRLSKSFGSLVVAKDVELSLPAGARYALIGPNGAGKTTLINLITGMLPPDGGRVLLAEEDVTGLEPAQRVKRGLARTFQINTLFPVSVRWRPQPSRYASGAGSPPRGGVGSAPTARRWTRRTAFSAPWRSMPCAIGRPASCPTGSSVFSRSRSRSPHGRACSCWTSRPRASPGTRAPGCSPRSRVCPRT